jgi:hypothetical protein
MMGNVGLSIMNHHRGYGMKGRIALYLRFTSRGGPRLSLGAEAGVFLNCATGSAKSSKRMGAGVGVGAGVSSAQCT